MAFTIGTYIDLKAMGDAFARRCGAKDENSLFFHVLRVASIAFVMVTLMGLAMMFLSVGFSLGFAFFPAYLASLPLTYLVALAVAFVAFAVCIPLTEILCTKPPKEPPTRHL